jgi:hypothetical protein
MLQPARFVASLTEIILSVTTCSAAGRVYGSGTAAADGSTIVPLGINLKRSDSSNVWVSNILGVVPATRQTTYIVSIRTNVTVTPDTHLVDAAPDTSCGLRLVEMPRSGVHCGANSGHGNGTAPVQESVMPGATGAWISGERPFLLGGERFDGGC